MPNRILRDGILTSEAVSSLSWAAEVFYRRLMSVADDHGRFHSTQKLLRAACYPLHIDKVSDSDIGKWTTECVAAGLVRVYPASDGKRYLEIVKFGQQVRSKSKFPEPTEDEHLTNDVQSQPPDSNCAQQIANAHLDVFVSGVVGEGDLLAQPAPKARASLVDNFDEFWQAYPKKRAKDDAMKAFAKRKPDRDLLDKMLKAIEAQKRSDDWLKDGGQFIPYPATWLNDARWMDEKTVLHEPIRGPDPALEKIKQDSAKATPMPKEVREKFQELLRAKVVSNAQQ